jgi:molybdenum cofactor cytidylyltransferase
MIFGRFPLDAADGVVLAHGIRTPRMTLKKGTVLGAGELTGLRAAGITEVVGVRLEPGDVPEDEAASAVALAAAGPGTCLKPAFTGRRSIYAQARGIAVIDAARVDRLNAIDEGLALATVPAYHVVEAGQMVATVKVNPLSVPASVIETGVALVGNGEPPVRVAPFQDMAAGLILTRLRGLKASVLDKTVATVRARLEGLGSHLAWELRCAHDEDAVAGAIAEAIAANAEPILIYGASAIVDRRDVVPAGIVKAGGAIDRFGMPVDPGNLTLLAHLGTTPILGLPGSARSPRSHGSDWLLQRLLADLPVVAGDIAALGVGGLLKDIPGRPQPRESRGRASPRPLVAAIVLAAGRSRRMGRRNKLLAEIDGAPMIARAVDAVLAAKASPVIVVTGHQAAKVRAVLAGREVRFAHNHDFDQGLSTSLKAGIEALPGDIDGALICLGDMPRVPSRHLDTLIATFDPREGRAICVPTARGKRGNPVLFGADFFDEMKAAQGDVGARHLIGTHDDQVFEVAIDDDGIFVDVDTPSALTALRTGTGGS